MADPTNASDPTYANDPNYVFSGGRWQYRGGGAAAGQPDPNAPAAGGNVSGETLGTLGGFGGLLRGLGDRLAGTPFASGGGVVPLVNNIPGANEMDARFRAGANAAPNANPYSTIVANQARPAQEALYAQMRAQQAGPSIANMQGQRAQGANLQAALGAGGGRGTMMQAGQIGGGLAGDTGMGRLAEQLRGSQGLGNMAAGVRGADLGVAGAQSQTGIQQRGLDDAMRQFYAGQGSKLDLARGRFKLEDDKLLGRLKAEGAKSNEDGVNGYISTLGTLFGMGGK